MELSFKTPGTLLESTGVVTQLEFIPYHTDLIIKGNLVSHTDMSSFSILLIRSLFMRISCQFYVKVFPKGVYKCVKIYTGQK